MKQKRLGVFTEATPAACTELKTSCSGDATRAHTHTHTPRHATFLFVSADGKFSTQGTNVKFSHNPRDTDAACWWQLRYRPWVQSSVGEGRSWNKIGWNSGIKTLLIFWGLLPVHLTPPQKVMVNGASGVSTCASRLFVMVLWLHQNAHRADFMAP